MQRKSKQIKIYTTEKLQLLIFKDKESKVK